MKKKKKKLNIANWRNANKNYNEGHLSPVRMAIIEKFTNTKC